MTPRKSTATFQKLFIIPKSKPTQYIGNYDQDGYKDGFGILKWSNGIIFKGYFEQDRINGWGIVIYNNQDIFKGEFSNGKANGFGNYLYRNGKIQIGYWANDIFSGVGYEFYNNEYYIGEFFKGEKTGIGTFRAKNKDNDKDNIIYEGEMRNNKYHGFGIKYDEDGNIHFGNFVNNFKEGFGESFSKAGQKFIGYFKNDQKQGFGLYYLLKQTYLVGIWENGKLEGITKIFIGKETNYGIWKKGKKVRTFMNQSELKNKSEFDINKYSMVLKFEFKYIRNFIEEDEEDRDYKSRSKK